MTRHAIRRRRAALWLVLGLGVAGAMAVLAGAATRAGHTPTRPSVILVSVPGCSADRLSAGGGGGVRSAAPHLDRMARDGVVFKNHYAQAADSTFSLASLFSSCYATSLGPLESEHFRLADPTPTLAKILKTYGYLTAAFTTGGRVSGDPGFTQGFDAHTDACRRAGFSVSEPLAVRWMRDHPARPCFVFIDGHECARDIAPHASNHDAALSRVDAWLATFFDEMREMKLTAANTLVVVLADRGEDRAEPGVLPPDRSLRRNSVHVPLIFWGAGVTAARAGTGYDFPTENVDVVPTILGLLGIPPPDDARGRDLSRFLRTGARPDLELASQVAYAEGTRGLSTVIGTDFQLICTGAPAGSDAMRGLIEDAHTAMWHFALYDLRKDPDERENLAGRGEHRRAFDKMRTLLLEKERLARRYTDSRKRRPLDPELRRSLQEHGYWE